VAALSQSANAIEEIVISCSGQAVRRLKVDRASQPRCAAAGGGNRPRLQRFDPQGLREARSRGPEKISEPGQSAGTCELRILLSTICSNMTSAELCAPYHGVTTVHLRQWNIPQTKCRSLSGAQLVSDARAALSTHRKFATKPLLWPLVPITPGPLSRLVSVVTSNVPANNACQMIGFADVLDLVDKKKLYRQRF
jgi:hypothetical protein